MALTLQNLRAVTPGVEPASLLPAQLCFNLADRYLFVGDGSNFKTYFDGTQVAGVPGEGWFQVPMDFDSLSNYYVIDPQFYGDLPLDGQVLTWDAALNRVVWATDPDPNVPDNYFTTNAAVDAAVGVDTSTKISNALGITPVEGDSVVVSGDPGDAFPGFYQFASGSWVFSAQYAFPTATQVPVAPILGISSGNVQGALEETLVAANAAQTTASNALTIANNALPKAGGTMSGNIQFTNGQPVDAGSF